MPAKYAPDRPHEGAVDGRVRVLSDAYCVVAGGFYAGTFGPSRLRRLAARRSSPARCVPRSAAHLPAPENLGSNRLREEMQFRPTGIPLSKHAGGKRPGQGRNATFLVTTSRFGAGDRPSAGPGPGTYHAPRAALGKGQGGGGAMRSKVPRLPTDRAFTGPGPGQYGIPGADSAVWGVSSRDCGSGTSSFAIAEPTHPPHRPRNAASKTTPGPGQHHGGKPGAFDRGKGAGLGPGSVPFRSRVTRLGSDSPHQRRALKNGPGPTRYKIPGSFTRQPSTSYTTFHQAPGHGGPLQRPVRLSTWVSHLVGTPAPEKDPVPGPGSYAPVQGTVAATALRAWEQGPSAAFRQGLVDRVGNPWGGRRGSHGEEGPDAVLSGAGFPRRGPPPHGETARHDTWGMGQRRTMCGGAAPAPQRENLGSSFASSAPKVAQTRVDNFPGPGAYAPHFAGRQSFHLRSEATWVA